MSTWTSPVPASSTRGVTSRHALCSAWCADAPTSSASGRRTSPGQRVRASASVRPGSTPCSRAAPLASTTRVAGGAPATIASGRSESAGSARSTAAATKCGTRTQANRLMRSTP